MPKYRLQIVLDQKKEKRDEAAKRLNEAIEALRQEERVLAKLEDDLRKNRETREKTELEISEKLAMGVLGIGKVQGMWVYIKSLEAQEKQILEYIERQKVKIKQAQQVVDKARLALIEAAKELKLMEKHKEKWMARIKKEIEEKEQKEMDEIGSAMYATRMIKEFKETKKKTVLKKIKEESYGN
jgi:flagellar export protein FliJ